MAEKDMNPAQTIPEQTVPEQAAPAQTIPVQTIPTAKPPVSETSRKGSPLLVFLTVLLILVGIIDVILWSIVGYYFLRNHLVENDGTPAQSISIGGTPAGGGEASGDTESQKALISYLQEMAGLLEEETAILESYGSVSGTNFTDDETMYTEITQRTIPLCQQLDEKVLAITPSDAEISEAHSMYRDYVTKLMNTFNMMSSALSSQDSAQVVEANDLLNETNDLATSYQQAIRRLAEERNVPLND